MKAVERNRIRRRLREAVRLAGAENARPGHDYVLVGRRGALTEPFTDLTSALADAMRRDSGDGRSEGLGAGAEAAMMKNNQNVIIAIALSFVIIVAWQYFIIGAEDGGGAEAPRGRAVADGGDSDTGHAGNA